jgi:hypothetical protein
MESFLALNMMPEQTLNKPVILKNVDEEDISQEGRVSKGFAGNC